LRAPNSTIFSELSTAMTRFQRRQDAEEQMAERLPRTSRAVAAVEAAGDLVEVNLGLLLPARVNPAQVDEVAVVFGQLLRAADGELGELTDMRVGVRAESVEGAFAVAACADESGLGQQAEVGGNPGLAEPGDLLEFVDG
jgi:hypothetical protein